MITAYIAIQIALIQYSGRSKHAWAFSETGRLSCTGLRWWRTKEPLLFWLGLGNRVLLCSLCSFVLWTLIISDPVYETPASETVKKISKITYTASRFLLLTSAIFAVRAVMSVWMKINRVTLNITKNLLFIFLSNGFITMCNRQKRLIRAAFSSCSCKRCSWTTKRHSD